ncbi:1-acyl-sn-glycerol-3-phosphate acyltransferase alpha [Harpegnathos saltator]|uniref:1-acyl-sn-glycerol-3-phosphate acyltransferase n=1 Tax=Harpegnathos saltator TaxID=610380 RepID=E2BSE2_HARSA|nr:1-acyl-sn-glycerol-3-phosphate acyltransferase alpha [Harpegnathos saltator]EFN81394.1 1-acyl-sn-glycerol-3-phosphate acyltransferase alpha [Harpegnathos saltator]
MASWFEVILICCILVLPFLYETSRTFRYHFKFFIYYFTVLFNALWLLPIFALRPRNVKNFVLASWFCHYISPLLGLRWELRGREHLEKDRACIIVANHQSSLDILGLFDLWPVMEKCTVVSKKELFYAWPFGLSTWLCGLIFIDRMNSESARSVLNNAAQQLKDKKVKLWIYPEGTRRNTGEIHPFKKGAFHVAIKSQVPILPVVFSSYYFLSAAEKRFDTGRILVTTLPPISTEGLSTNDVEDLMQRTRDAMCEVFHAVNLENQTYLAR